MATRAICPESLIRDKQIVTVSSPLWAFLDPTLVIKTCHQSYIIAASGLGNTGNDVILGIVSIRNPSARENSQFYILSPT